MMSFKLLFASLLTSTLLAANSTLAETTELDTEGMHCNGCKKIIEKTVCKDAKLAESLESCEVQLVDEKKQLGLIKVTPKAGKKIDTSAVQTLIQNAGDYKTKIKEIKK